MDNMSLFSVIVLAVVGGKVGAYRQQMLTELCPQNQMLEHALCWALEGPTHGTGGQFCGGRDDEVGSGFIECQRYRRDSVVAFPVEAVDGLMMGTQGRWTGVNKINETIDL